jgi:hypothetical protein
VITVSAGRTVYRPGPLFYAVAYADALMTNPERPRPARKPARHKAAPRPRRDHMKLATIRKALAGAVAAAVAAAIPASEGGFTGAEYAVIVGAAIVAGLAVFQIPNKPAVGGDAGQVDVGLVLLVFTFVGVLLLLFGVGFN